MTDVSRHPSRQRWALGTGGTSRLGRCRSFLGWRRALAASGPAARRRTFGFVVLAIAGIIALISAGCSATPDTSGREASAQAATAAPSPTDVAGADDRTSPDPTGPADPADPTAPDDRADAADGQTDDAQDTDDDGAQGTRPGRDVPPLVLPSTAPGSGEAWAALQTELDRFITDEQRRDGVPWPDLRNPDPVAVYRSCAEFQTWMAEHNATPSLVEAYTAPASPERGWDVELFAEYRLFDILSTPSTPPYTMRVEGVVHPAATDITDALLADVPDGSVAVVYYDSVGTSELVHPDGTVFTTRSGWSDLGPWVAIMAPTDVGWQVWWDELTDVVPPGLDDHRGSPVEPGTRRDV